MRGRYSVAAGFCAAICLLGAALQAATLFRQPYLQDVRTDRATIMWATDDNGTGTVEFATDPGFSRSAFVTAQTRLFPPFETGYPTAITQYEATLANLAPSTEYFYRVRFNGQPLAAAPGLLMRFRTAGPGPFIFLAFGDSGQATPAQFQIYGSLFLQTDSQLPANERASLILHTGDIAYFSGTYDEFQSRHFGVYQLIMSRIPFFPTPGNHEYDFPPRLPPPPRHAAPYLALHSLPVEGVPGPDRERYYSFDWGNVHFVSLDSNEPLERVQEGNRAMLDWLDQDLGRSRQFWRIVYFHHPPYGTGFNTQANDPNIDLARQLIVPILEKHNVPLVLNGHEHNYSRSLQIRGGATLGACPRAEEGPCAITGTQYIVTGGGGASLYPIFPSPFLVSSTAASAHHYLRAEVQGEKLTIRALAADGQEIDSVTLAPRPEITSASTVNAASFLPAVAPGTLVSIFGRYLGPNEAIAPTVPLPQQLGGAEVTLDGRRLPLLYTARQQINAQLPFDFTGTATLRVTTQNGSSEATLNIAPAAPGIFSVDPRTSVVTHSDGTTLVTPASPAQPGEVVVIYMTGLGAVNGDIVAGSPTPPSPLLLVRAAVSVLMGGVAVRPEFAGLAPGFVGLYQVNARVPQLSTGSHSLRVEVGGVGSNVANLPVNLP